MFAVATSEVELGGCAAGTYLMRKCLRYTLATKSIPVQCTVSVLYRPVIFGLNRFLSMMLMLSGPHKESLMNHLIILKSQLPSLPVPYRCNIDNNLFVFATRVLTGSRIEEINWLEYALPGTHISAG
jgi:hypothetical protein